MPEELDFLDGRGKVRFLEDRLEFHCKIEQSFGHPDEYKEEEIPYDSIPNLPLEPENNFFKCYDDFTRFAIHIPKIDKTIVFFIARSRDTDVHPCWDETLCGPYLAKENISKKCHNWLVLDSERVY